MVELTDFEKIFNAQTVKCTIGVDTIAGEVTVRPGYVTPITRHNTRGGPIDTFTSHLDDIIVTATVTDALRAILVTNTTLNTRFVPPTIAVTLTALSVGGTSDLSVAFNARIFNVNYDAPRTGVYEVSWTMRIKA